MYSLHNIYKQQQINDAKRQANKLINIKNEAISSFNSLSNSLQFLRSKTNKALDTLRNSDFDTVLDYVRFHQLASFAENLYFEDELDKISIKDKRLYNYKVIAYTEYLSYHRELVKFIAECMANSQNNPELLTVATTYLADLKSITSPEFKQQFINTHIERIQTMGVFNSPHQTIPENIGISLPFEEWMLAQRSRPNGEPFKESDLYNPIEDRSLQTKRVLA